MTPSSQDAIATRAIRLEVEAPGTPDELWEMIATGPGITSWFVPAQVDPGARTISLTLDPMVAPIMAPTRVPWTPAQEVKMAPQMAARPAVRMPER